MSEPERLKPSPSGWRVEEVSADWTVWRSPDRKLRILVSVHAMNGYHEHHLSVSKRPRRPDGAPRRANDLECRQALAAFGAQAFEEDNHCRGVARQFWHAADVPMKSCACLEQTPVVDPKDGYTWRP